MAPSLFYLRLAASMEAFTRQSRFPGWKKSVGKIKEKV